MADGEGGFAGAKRSTMYVEQMLTRARERLATIGADAPVRAAAEQMARSHTDLLVVCARAVMVGGVTKTDIVRQIARCGGGAGVAFTEGVAGR